MSTKNPSQAPRMALLAWGVNASRCPLAPVAMLLLSRVSPSPPFLHFVSPGATRGSPGSPTAAPRAIRSTRRSATSGKCRLLASGQVHAHEDNGPAHDLLRTEGLAEKDYTGGYAGRGDQVLVDEHLVCPDAADPPLPPGEGEGSRQGRRVPQRRPGAHAHAPPLHAREVRQREDQDDRTAEEGRVGRHR